MSKCKHEWYPVKIILDSTSNETFVTVYRVCRKCWAHQLVPSEWDSGGD